MSFKRRNIPMTDDLKKEISGAKNIFEVFDSMSRETPPGAYPLNTGEWIRGCQTLYPEFYQKAVEYGSKNYIRTGTNAQYEAELASTGQSGMFVIEGSDIRLPKVTRYIRGMALYIQVFNQAPMAGYVNVQDVLKLITDYTKQMDQKIQDALNTINSIIEGGALGMPEYERSINLGENAYVGTYTYTAPSDGWFYVRWVNSNAEPTRITAVHIYKDASKSRLLATHTTSDGRRAGKDGGVTDQTIFIPVKRGYYLKATHTNYRRFYPIFGQ